MTEEKRSFKLLSNNALKIIACVSMILDHTGMMLFPEITFFRILGRVGFPIFAYLIAEGAKHTKNKLRHLLTMAGFGIAMQTVFFIVTGSMEMNVLITFTFSLLVIYSLDYLKSAVCDKNSTKRKTIVSSLLFALALSSAVAASIIFDLDYGLAGCLLPVFPSLFNTPKMADPPTTFKTVDTKTFRILATSIGTACLCIGADWRQVFGFSAIPLLCLYSEKRGKLKLKYLFYVFYPLHLAILQGIAILIR